MLETANSVEAEVVDAPSELDTLLVKGEQALELKQELTRVSAAYNRAQTEFRQALFALPEELRAEALGITWVSEYLASISNGYRYGR